MGREVFHLATQQNIINIIHYTMKKLRLQFKNQNTTVVGLRTVKLSLHTRRVQNECFLYYYNPAGPYRFG